jgi:hypothetical protein
MPTPWQPIRTPPGFKTLACGQPASAREASLWPVAFEVGRGQNCPCRRIRSQVRNQGTRRTLGAASIPSCHCPGPTMGNRLLLGALVTPPGGGVGRDTAPTSLVFQAFWSDNHSATELLDLAVSPPGKIRCRAESGGCNGNATNPRYRAAWGRYPPSGLGQGWPNQKRNRPLRLCSFFVRRKRRPVPRAVWFACPAPAGPVRQMTEGLGRQRLPDWFAIGLRLACSWFAPKRGRSIFVQTNFQSQKGARPQKGISRSGRSVRCGIRLS